MSLDEPGLTPVAPVLFYQCVFPLLFCFVLFVSVLPAFQRDPLVRDTADLQFYNFRASLAEQANLVSWLEWSHRRFFLPLYIVAFLTAGNHAAPAVLGWSYEKQKF